VQVLAHDRGKQSGIAHAGIVNHVRLSRRRSGKSEA
jgi:hypothetical protein